MQDDNTYMLVESSDTWRADWGNATSTKRHSWNGDYNEVVVEVFRHPAAPRPSAPEGWKVYSNGCVGLFLKHASSGNTLLTLKVKTINWVAVAPDGTRHRIHEELPFRAKGKRYTLHFKSQVETFMGGFGATLKKCAGICHTTPAIVKEINKARLFTLAGNMLPLHPSRHIAVDEFLIAHGYRYCTIVIDADTGELLYLERGKGRQQVNHFFAWVGEEFMGHVKAVSMDMNASYAAAFAERYPDIAIVYDCFHVIQWFNKQVIDSLRCSEAKRLEKEAAKLAKAGDIEGAAEVEAERRLLFGARFNLLANERTLRAKDALNAELNAEAKAAALADGRDPSEVGHRRQDHVEGRAAILDANATLQCAVRAREELQDALKLTDPVAMRATLLTWSCTYALAGIAQLTKFAKMVRNKIKGLVARATHRISSGILEGTNTLVKNIRRQAFGLVDFDYFGLLLWEQTHRPNRRRRAEQTREYHREKKRNSRLLKQTIYKQDLYRQKEAAHAFLHA